MNINQQRQENRQDFQIDQNEQNINRLRKKTKELSDGFDALSQSASVSQTDIASLKTDVANAKSDIAELKSTSSATEETVELLSYDIVKIVDNTYRNNKWEPAPVFFRCDAGTKVKIKIRFNIKNTFESCPTITTSIQLDGKDIFAEVYTLTSQSEERNINLEHIFTSSKEGHKIEINIKNQYEESLSSNYDKPDFFIIELFGTNVQFVSRHNDFVVIPAGESRVVMATTCIDEKPRFLMKEINENFTINSSEFRTAKFGSYRYYNKIMPFDYYQLNESGEICHSEKPCISWIQYENVEKTKRAKYSMTIPDNETELVPSMTSFVYVVSARPTMQNVVNDGKPYFVGIMPDNIIKISHQSILNSFLTAQNEEIFADLCGVLRIDNYEDVEHIPAIITRADGTSFLAMKQGILGAVSRFELGYGTHPNAYLNTDGNFEIYLRVGSSIKKLIVSYNKNNSPQIISSKIIPNVQEYWLAPSGAHFERVGQQIRVFLQNSTEPTCTFEVFY